MTLTEIMNEITFHFPSYSSTDNRNNKLGILLKRELGYEAKRKSEGMVYMVMMRDNDNPHL